MRRIRIEHKTRYEYPETVVLLEHKLHLRPREGHDIRIESSRLEIAPAYGIRWHRDVFGNSVAVVTFGEPSGCLEIDSEVVVQHYADQPVEVSMSEDARQYPFQYDPMEQIDLMPYQISVFPQDNASLREWMEGLWRPGALFAPQALIDAINNRIAGQIEYEMREEPGVQSPAQTLARARGSCRDLATFFVEACRHCGLAARFVSGYLLSSAAVQDFASSHAWSEVYLPGSGWLGFDSTSGQRVGGDHIAVAVHRHPQAIPPIAGSFVGALALQPRLVVDVHVRLL